MFAASVPTCRSNAFRRPNAASRAFNCARVNFENWSINARGRLGIYQFRIQHVGYALAWASSATVRIGLLLSGATVLLVATLRRIWSS